MEDNSNVKPEDDVTVVDPIEDLSKLTPIQNKYVINITNISYFF